MRRQWLILAFIIAISVILRVGVSLYFGNQVKDFPGTADQISYHNLALRVLSGHGFSFGEPWWPLTGANAPTAHWSFLYTGYLTLSYALFSLSPLAARLIQAMIVGSLHPFLIFLIGRRVYNPSVGLIAAALTAIYTYFVYYAAALMTEPFYIIAILTSLYLAIVLVDCLAVQPGASLDKKTLFLAIGLGFALGLAILLRQLFLLFVPFLFFWIWWASRKVSSKKAFSILLMAGLLLALMVLPFTLYNYTRFHRFVLLNTNAGFAFYWANHPIYGTHFEPILPPEMGTYLDLIPRELRRLDEAALDQALLRLSLQIIIDDPVRYIFLSLSRIPPYFMFWPSQASDPLSNLARVGGFGLLLPFMLYGLVRAFLPQNPMDRITFSSPAFLLLLFALIYTLIHLLSWTLVRYRLPVDAVLLVFAGLGLYDLGKRLRNKFIRKSLIQ